MHRKIIHVDMDAFYAAVEQRDDPSLRGRAVVVGGSPFSRGVVATASYEARRFGIHSAMPAAQAYRLCPQAVFLPPHFAAYREVSQQVHRLFLELTDRVEPLSLDEAYLDVTLCAHSGGSATRIAQSLRQRIREETGLTASAGVSYNKFLAKIASDLKKPDGLTVILPADGPAFVEQLPIRKFFGIGKATEAKMLALGIRTGADLKAWSMAELRRQFGRLAEWYYGLARGIDERPVIPNRERKSLGSETTFPRDVACSAQMESALEELAAEVITGLRMRNLAGRTLTVKVKYADFTLVSRSMTVPEPLADLGTLRPLLSRLLAKTEAAHRPVRLLGVSVSRLQPLMAAGCPARQLDLFDA